MEKGKEKVKEPYLDPYAMAAKDWITDPMH